MIKNLEQEGFAKLKWLSSHPEELCEGTYLSSGNQVLNSAVTSLHTTGIPQCLQIVRYCLQTYCLIHISLYKKRFKIILKVSKQKQAQKIKYQRNFFPRHKEKLSTYLCTCLSLMSLAMNQCSDIYGSVIMTRC